MPTFLFAFGFLGEDSLRRCKAYFSLNFLPTISASVCGFCLPQVVPSHCGCIIYLWTYILFYELKGNIINFYWSLK